MPPAPLSAEEQDLLTWLLSSIPRWFWMDDPRFSVQELWASVVKSMIEVQRQGEDWVRATFILTATDVWLSQHARDRGSFRQSIESDPALRERLRTYEDAVTVPALLAVAQSILTAEGISGQPFIVELKRDKGFYLTETPIGGVGGAIVATGTTCTIDTGVQLSGYEKRQELITIAGAAHAANNGTFTITDVIGDNTIAYTNSTPGFTEALGAGTWQVRANYLNRRNAYMGRGYRMSVVKPSSFIVILPFGSTAGTVEALLEAYRLKKAAGFGAIVERRQSP